MVARGGMPAHNRASVSSQTSSRDSYTSVDFASLSPIEERKKSRRNVHARMRKDFFKVFCFCLVPPVRQEVEIEVKGKNGYG